MFDETPASLTPVSQLGEFGLIDHLTKHFPIKNPAVIKGPGDDAAVILQNDGTAQVITTDLLVEGIHFDLSYVPLRHLGYKAVAVNLSDVAAMNARPQGITVGIAMSNRFTVEAMDELYAGIHLACERYGVDLLGGDMSGSKQGLVISITATGTAPVRDIVYRSGAKPQELICVTGDLGAAYAGFLVLDRERVAYMKEPGIQPDLSEYDYVLGRQLKPEPRLDVTDTLRELGIKPSAMMDISDGIASELHHICRQSRCGATIFANKLPIDLQTLKVAEEFEISPLTFAMNGGEDYELIFTIPLTDFEKIKGQGNIHVIGKTTPDEGILQIILEDGQVADIEAQGWQHFDKK